MPRTITTIGFDADDTLWHNENLFEEHHRHYCELLSEFHDATTVEEKLFKTEIRNLELYGYGVKSFTLSSIETAIELTQGALRMEELGRIIELGKIMLAHPVELLNGVSDVIEKLRANYRLILITKGDLRDQERKIKESGIAHHFNQLEIVSNKSAADYGRILDRAGTDASEFMMVGNSVKSDVLPILELGGNAVHIPYPITWQHERVSDLPADNDRFFALESISQLPDLLNSHAE